MCCTCDLPDAGLQRLSAGSGCGHHPAGRTGVSQDELELSTGGGSSLVIGSFLQVLQFPPRHRLMVQRIK